MKAQKRKALKLNVVTVPYSSLVADGLLEKWLAEEGRKYSPLSIPMPWQVKQPEKRNGNSMRTNPDDVTNLAYDFIGTPDFDQEILFGKTVGCCRFIWNRMKSDKDTAYEKDGTVLKPTPAEYKKDPDLLWLKEVDSLALCNVQINLEKAYREYLSGERGKPRFKKKGLSRDSFTTNLSNKENPNLRLEGNLLYLPKVKDPVKLKLHRPIKPGGILKQCTVSKDPVGKWHFALVFEYPAEEQRVKSPILRFLEDGDLDSLKHIGLNMSLPYLYIDSNGNKPQYSIKSGIISFEKHYRKLERRIAREQRRLSHMKQGSSNYRKQCVRIAKLHAKAKHQRSDFLHQMSIRLVREYDVISIEDLDIFGKSVSDNGWGNFVTMLQYKGERHGTMIVKVDRWFPSSKTCCKCGYVNKELEMKDRIYYCPKCGNLMDRDHQAGVNLDAEGLRILLEAYNGHSMKSV
jgi:putative transposase